MEPGRKNFHIQFSNITFPDRLGKQIRIPLWVSLVFYIHGTTYDHITITVNRVDLITPRQLKCYFFPEPGPVILGVRSDGGLVGQATS